MTDVEDAELGRLAAATIERGHMRGDLIDVTAPGGIARSPLCVIGSFYYAATGDGWGDPLPSGPSIALLRTSAQRTAMRCVRGTMPERRTK